MEFAELVTTSKKVASTRKRLEKIETLAFFLRRLVDEEVALGVSYLSGELPQGKIGLGPRMVDQILKVADDSPSAFSLSALSLSDVDRTFTSIAEARGTGSNTERRRRFRELLERTDADGRELLCRLVIGEVRQGALLGVMIEAVARAAEVDSSRVRRATMLKGEVASVAQAAFEAGETGLAEFRLELFRPVQPMLAHTAETVGDVFKRMETAAFEVKLDGARIQVHKFDEEVRVYTRALHEVTHAVPEVVETVGSLPCRELILDGEAIALRADGRPRSFQTTMKRFGRRLDVEKMRATLPLSMFFFDCLLHDGESLIDCPSEARVARMHDVIPERFRVARLVTSKVEEAESFVRLAADRGHEGVMAKSLDSGYEAGGRGFAWLKLKPVHTLDLVVLGVEWGSGRRKGLLSNLHLGARDEETGDFVMLGKTFKGMTDKMLAWQTERLLELEVSRSDWVVTVRPELVVEIAFNDIQSSPHYPGGMALRFARVRAYREDKKPEEADSLQTVRDLFESQAD